MSRDGERREAPADSWQAQEGITGEGAVGDNRRGEKVAGDIEARNGHFGPYNDLLAKLKKANQDLEQARKNLEQANKNTEQANRNAEQANKDVEEAKKNVTIQTVLSLSTITAMATQSAQLVLRLLESHASFY